MIVAIAALAIFFILSMISLSVFGPYVNDENKVNKILEGAHINTVNANILCTDDGSYLVKNNIILIGIFCKWSANYKGRMFRIYRFSKLSKTITDKYNALYADY